METWKEEDVKFLKDNYKKLSYIEISKKLNRTVGSIYWKAHELKLNKGRWDDRNRLTKKKVIKLLKLESQKIGKSPSARELPISIRSACQRHFGNLNNAKKAAKLDFRKLITPLPKRAYKKSKELAYIIGLLLGDGSFRHQKSLERTSYVICFATKDVDLMKYFTSKFRNWSNIGPKFSIIKDGYRTFPNGVTSYYNKTYYTQICSKEAWIFLKSFKNEPLKCIDFFDRKSYCWILKGLWDAEGCLRQNGSNLRTHFSNSNKDIISLYKNLLEKYDLRYQIEKQSGREMVNVTISDKFNIIKFITIIKGITIKRKKNSLIKEKIKKLKKEYRSVNFNLSFDEQVYQMVKKIPCGRISTYGEIAMALNNKKAYRAVGQALRNNPYAPIVPCHRVIASNGLLGGFNGKASGKEIQRKIHMLEKEGIKIKNNKIVDFEKVLYHFK